jgi:hypothetical protein
MPHYCLGPQDAETKDQVWVAASSEKRLGDPWRSTTSQMPSILRSGFVDMTLLGRRRPGSS